MQLSDLILLARQRSDMENNAFISDAELTSYLNNSLAELDDVLVTNYEDYRLSNYVTVLASGGAMVIPLPADFYKLRGVDLQVNGAGTGQWFALRAFQFPERNRLNNNAALFAFPYGRARLSYRLADQGIMLEPADQAQGTYQVWYTPLFNPLIQMTDLLPQSYASQAWTEYAIVDACIKILGKQNLDPSGFMAEKAALKVRILGASKNRNAAGPKRVADTRGAGGGDYGFCDGGGLLGSGWWS